jgi:hypothetical protein
VGDAKLELAGAAMDWLFDDRTDCFSVQTTMPIRAYLKLVEGAHSMRGGLPGQRDTLKTTTAKRIRTRMVTDIRRGAVLPPVVLGAVVDDDALLKHIQTQMLKRRQTFFQMKLESKSQL